MRLATQIATVLVLAAAGGGAWYALSGDAQAPTQAQGPQAGQAQAPGPGGQRPGGGARPVPVVAQTATRGDILVTFDAVGTLRANEAVTITSKQAGIVKAIQFGEGQPVQAGAVLVELDDTEVRAELAVAEAERRTVAQELERSQSLLGRQAVAQARVDTLRTELQGADARVNAARARLQDLTIRAPFAGVTGLRHVSPGALVRPADPITSLDDTGVLKLDFTVPEMALRSLKPGMPISATSSVFPGEAFQGTVEAIDTRVDPVTRNLAVVARLPNTQQRLRPGMFMQVQLTLDTRAQVVLVREESLVPVGDQQYAFVVVDNKVQRRPLRIGARQAGMVEVAEGVQEGELVITRGTQKVREGQPVAVQIDQVQSAQRPPSGN